MSNQITKKYITENDIVDKQYIVYLLDSEKFYKTHTLSDSFIELYFDQINLTNLILNQKLSEYILNKYSDSFLKYTGNLVENQSLPESFIENNFKQLTNTDSFYHCNLEFIKVQSKNLSENFFENHLNYLKGNLVMILYSRKFSEEFMKKHIDIFKYEMRKVFETQELSVEFIESNIIQRGNLYTDWNPVIKKQVLPEEIIYKYQDRFFLKHNITDLLTYQQVPEKLLLKKKKLFNDWLWQIMAQKQKLSNSFIQKYIIKFLPIKDLKMNKFIDQTIIEKYELLK